jgi:hypothetical protein
MGPTPGIRVKRSPDPVTRGAANLMLLADILEAEDVMHRATGQPTYNQAAHEHDCGTPACALSHWYAYKGTTWLDADVDEVLAEFALTPAESLELFGIRGCGNARTAQEAARYIRAFVTRRNAAWGEDLAAARSGTVPRSYSA